MRSSKVQNRGKLTMTAYACGSGGVIFVPEKIEKKTESLMAIRRSNDNATEESED